MKTLLTLAWRNLWRKKRRTLITVSSVLFAVVIAVAFISYVKGLQEQMIESFVRYDTGYLQVQDILYHDEPSLDHTFEYGREVIDALEPFQNEINFTVPRIQGFSLIAKETTSRSAWVTGIIPEMEDRMSKLLADIVEGRMFADEDDFAVIGQGLADMLDIAVGDTIVLIGQGFQAMTAAGKFKVGGIIKFTLPEKNNSIVYLPLKEAQWYFAAEARLTNLVIMIDDEERAFGLAQGIQNNLDDEWYKVRTWDELLPDLVGLIEMRETVNKIMIWVLYIVVGFGILGTILNMMHERRREFGILMSVGLKRKQLGFMCFMETLFISIIGVMSGVFVGFIMVYILYRNPIPATGVFEELMLDYGMEPIFRFSIAPDVFIFQAVTVFLITMVIGLYVIRKIFKLDMLHAARN
jgi:putative ABC transport system permease protein